MGIQGHNLVIAAAGSFDSVLLRAWLEDAYEQEWPLPGEWGASMPLLILTTPDGWSIYTVEGVPP